MKTDSLNSRVACPIGIILAGTVLIATVIFMTIRNSTAQTTNVDLAGASLQKLKAEMKMNVFFGTTKALSVGELRTNAVEALRIKGLIVPEPNYCVINVQVEGKQSGCGIMFWDLSDKMMYQVKFNARGEVENVWGGLVRHGTPAPGDPRPKLPEGGVRVKP